MFNKAEKLLEQINVYRLMKVFVSLLYLQFAYSTGSQT